jgi:hypothetical protein
MAPKPSVSPTGGLGPSKYPVLPDISYNNNDQYFQSTEPAASASGLSADAIQKAQKFGKFGMSALQYEDIATAITNFEQCLRILKTGK